MEICMNIGLMLVVYRRHFAGCISEPVFRAEQELEIRFCKEDSRSVHFVLQKFMPHKSGVFARIVGHPEQPTR